MYNDLLERHTVLRVLAWLLAVIAALVAGGMIWSVIIHFGGIILLFFLAWVITFVLQPLSTFLERRGMPRLLSVSLIYFALLAASVGSIVLALPTLHSEVTLIAGEVTSTFTPSNLGHLADQAVAYLHHLGMSTKDAQNLVNQISGRIPEFTGNLANSLVATSTSLLGTAATLLFDTLLVLILSFYMMLDGDRLMESWVQKLPPSWLPDVRLLQRHIDVIFGGFLRAQLIIALVYGAFTWLVLAGLGQPNGLIFALLAAFLMLIPFIGPFLAVVPPVVAVLLQSPPDVLVRNIVIALIALFVAQQITMQGVAPRVMSAQVGLHPLLLFAALLVGAEEGGVWGAVFAGPVAAVIVAMLDTFFERFQRASGLYPDVKPGLEAAAEMQADRDIAAAAQLEREAAGQADQDVAAVRRGEAPPRAQNGHHTPSNGAAILQPDAEPDSHIERDSEVPRDPAMRR
jgi:predicted PurR-regulated permease PerM